MKQVEWLIAFFSVFGLTSNAQYNSDYMQYMFNGLLINPAYAGSQGALNITALYRRQWLGFNGSPTNTSFTFHMPLKNKKINVGAVLVNDQFGFYNHTKADLIYAYRIKFLKGSLSFGLQAGIDSYSANRDRINTQDPGDPNFAPGASRTIKPEAMAGTYYHTSDFYLGLTLGNLLTRGVSSYFLTSVTSGCILKANDHFRVKPAVLFKFINHSPISANISTTFYYKDIIGFGTGYTYKNSAHVYSDIKINQQLNFGYAYAYPLNGLNGYTRGSHEMMLRYLFSYKISVKSARYF